MVHPSQEKPPSPSAGDEGQGAPVRARVRSGVLFLGAGNAAARGVRLSVQFLLYWLLDPVDFGIFAMTLAFVEVLQMLSEFGVGMAVIQKRDMTPAYPTTAFWLNLAVGLLMLGAAWAGAPILAGFYNEPAVTLVVRVSALNFVVLSLRTIPMAILRKEMRFGRYAALEAAWNTATGLLSVGFAFAGARYWSLVIPPMITGLLIAPAWFYAAGWRPSLRVDTALLREIFGYSRFVVGSSLLGLATLNFGFIFAGHFHGTDQAGLYKFAMQNSSIVVLNFAWLVANATMSGFALLQGDREQLRNAFLRALKALTATTLPIHILLFVLTPQIFEVFPEKWGEAAALFRILLVIGALRTVTAHHVPLFNAVGRADITFRYFLVIALVGIPGMYAGCRWYGLPGLAWATCLVFCGGTITMLLLTPRLLGWKRIGYVRENLAFILASLLAGAVAYGSARFFGDAGLPALPNFFAASTVAGVCYLVALYCGARTQLWEVIELIVPNRFRGRRFEALFMPRDGVESL
jgi:polysaccharide transporter, PST family